MNERITSYGRLQIDDTQAVFAEAARRIERVGLGGSASRPASVALSGGSTPKALFRSIVENHRLPREATGHLLWTVSDERMVHPSDPESNLGNLDRELLTPLALPSNAKIAWPVELGAEEAAAMYASIWQERAGTDRLYDLCFVGMGDDGHTLSLFPGSPLLQHPVSGDVAAVEVAEKGWRLTVTPTGLHRCREIVALVCGAAKAARLVSVLDGPPDPLTQPIQLLAEHADRVTWLVDRDAAAQLKA
ncbi:MAG: 6-phosphogluconolactonase [Opitutales bacterium]